jgi:hypothetical protein
MIGPITVTDRQATPRRGLRGGRSHTASRTPWRAIAHHGVRPAPGGLALVHDFLNTRATQENGADPLGSHASDSVDENSHSCLGAREQQALPVAASD